MHTFHTSTEENYYVVSRMLKYIYIIHYIHDNRWLDQWKKRQPMEKLPPLNEDIAMRPKVVLKYEPID